MTTPPDAAALIGRHRDSLTPAERRVADVVLSDPQAVAFGTVAEVASLAATSGATVVRLATRLGLSGFSELQDRVRAEVSTAVLRATERIRTPRPDDLLDRAVTVATAAVRSTLDRVDRDSFDRAVSLLARPSHHVVVLAAEATSGIGEQFAKELGLLRSGVTQVRGSGVAVSRRLAELGPGDAVVLVDLPRYDRWLLDAATTAHRSGGRLVAVTDSALSPLAAHADVLFTIASDGPGPFDSHVAALALLESVVAGVALSLGPPAVARLDHIEAAWDHDGVFTD